MRTKLLSTSAVLLGLAAGCADTETADPADSSPTTTTDEPTEEPPTVTIGVEKVAGGLTTPVAIVSPADEPERVYVIDAVGLISEIGPDGSLTTFLDLRDTVPDLSTTLSDTTGLLGLAFHPAYTENRRVFVFYTAPPQAAGQHHVNVLSEFAVRPDGTAIDPASEQVLLEIPQEFTVHPAGQLLFDSTGALLVFLGDGGDPFVNSQDPASLLGKVLRYDVDRTPGQLVPAVDASPIAGAPPEVVAMGLRHPWRVSYDAERDEILFAEPAPGQFQEVNRLEPGANYGWPLDRPTSCLPTDGSPPDACLTGPAGEELTVAVAEYGPELGDIIAGAHRYGGSELPELDGLLVMAEWGFDVTVGQQLGGRVHVADATGEPPWTVVNATLDPGVGRSLIWGMDADGTGELYLLTTSTPGAVEGGGSLFKIVSAEVE